MIPQDPFPCPRLPNKDRLHSTYPRTSCTSLSPPEYLVTVDQKPGAARIAVVVVAGALLPALGPAAVGLARNQVAEASAATAAVVVEAALLSWRILLLE